MQELDQYFLHLADKSFQKEKLLYNQMQVNKQNKINILTKISNLDQLTGVIENEKTYQDFLKGLNDLFIISDNEDILTAADVRDIFNDVRLYKNVISAGNLEDIVITESKIDSVIEAINTGIAEEVKKRNYKQMEEDIDSIVKNELRKYFTIDKLKEGHLHFKQKGSGNFNVVGIDYKQVFKRHSNGVKFLGTIDKVFIKQLIEEDLGSRKYFADVGAERVIINFDITQDAMIVEDIVVDRLIELLGKMNSIDPSNPKVPILQKIINSNRQQIKTMVKSDPDFITLFKNETYQSEGLIDKKGRINLPFSKFKGDIGEAFAQVIIKIHLSKNSNIKMRNLGTVDFGTGSAAVDIAAIIDGIHKIGFQIKNYVERKDNRINLYEQSINIKKENNFNLPDGYNRYFNNEGEVETIYLWGNIPKRDNDIDANNLEDILRMALPNLLRFKENINENAVPEEFKEYMDITNNFYIIKNRILPASYIFYLIYKQIKKETKKNKESKLINSSTFYLSNNKDIKYSNTDILSQQQGKINKFNKAYLCFKGLTINLKEAIDQLI